jgi:predicted ATPase
MFLFTDIEGSTRRWEADPETMRVELAAHDDVLRSMVEAHGGWLFKHTGDGVCAAFSGAGDAVAAAVDAQRRLGLPVRMGVGTGSAELRGEDYVGSALNRTARVMAVGHGGQILVAASTAALLDGVDLVDLGEHRLRDLSGAYRLFQVRAEGLGERFPPLGTLDAVPGNLPVLGTSFIGRDVEVKELSELVRAHRLATLTGVGGVGKTRLAVQVAAELTGDFPDGLWLVELAPVGDPAAVPDAVASELGITAQAGRSVTDSIAQALSGRNLLIVLDNCEHVLDAAADLVDAVLAGTSTVKVIATSREGLRVGAEHLWPVPSLDLEGGSTSAAVELFVERAHAVNPRFELGGAAEAVEEICRRLDGIALAIELAAARMVSMSPMEVLERLQDRFRLLAGSRRGLERHQTLRHAVGWSYDLLDDSERTLLNVCSVFADGFDLAAAAHLSDSTDEYAVLDVLDSLVRKSLVTAQQTGGRTRYGLLETIRQFAEDQLGATGSIEQMRDRHATYYAEQAVAHWGLWDGIQQRVALDWLDAELANLRVGFRWATDRGQLATAAAIAAHATMLGWALQRFEPVGWAEELLPAAIVADLVQLPRLYAAASVCTITGRPDDALGHAESAVRLAADPRYDPFPGGWSSYWAAVAEAIAGRYERALEICAHLAAQSGLAGVWGLCGQTQLLAVLGGRYGDATVIAEETVAAARVRANPTSWPMRCTRAGSRTPRPNPPGRWPSWVRDSPTPASIDSPSGRRTSPSKQPSSRRCMATMTGPSPSTTAPSVRSTSPPMRRTWPSRSPTSPCSSTGSNAPTSPPSSTAPPPTAARPSPAAVPPRSAISALPSATSDSSVASPPGRAWSSPTQCTTPDTRSTSRAKSSGPTGPSRRCDVARFSAGRRSDGARPPARGRGRGRPGGPARCARR